MSTIYNCARSLFDTVYSYVSNSKVSEDQCFKNLNEAYEALAAHATEVFPLLLDSTEGSKFSRLENAVELLQANGFIMDSELISRFQEALRVYEDNFSGFVGLKPGDNSTLEERAQEASKKAQAQGNTDEKLNYRAEFYQQLVRKDYLAQEAESEAGAYANFIDLREKLRLAFQLGSDDKVQVSDLERLGSAQNLNPKLQLYVQTYLEAEAKYQEKFQTWFDSNPNVSSRILLKQAREQVEAGGEELFVWKGRAEILEKRVQQLDQVVRDGFTELYDTYHSAVENESSALHGRLSQIDPNLVGESRWGNSSWKVVRLFTWIGNTYSAWKNSKEATNLTRKYQSLKDEVSTPKPMVENDVKSWMDRSATVESLLPEETKQTLEESKKRYLDDIKPHLKHETLEAVVAGRDGEISKEQELRMLYQSLKAKNPGLRDKQGEAIEFNDRESALYVTGVGYTVIVGTPAEGSAKSTLSRTLMGGDLEGEVTSLLKDKIIPPNVVGYVRWKDSSKREILYAQPQVATFESVGEKGDKDLLKSKIVASDRIVFETTDEGEVKFEAGALRFGCYVSDYDKALKKAPGLVKTIALPILKRSYPNGTKVTLNLTSMSVALVENAEKNKTSRKASMDYSLNEKNKVELEHGDEFNQTLLGLARSNPIGHYKGLPKLRSNFEGITWKTL